MTKELKDIKNLQECIDILDNILGYHYKNLTKKQYNDLCDITEYLDNLNKEKPKKLMWEYENELIKMKDSAYSKVYSNKCKTLKDFIDLGFNSVQFLGKNYWKEPDGNYTSSYEDEISENLLNTKVYFWNFDTVDDYEYLIVKREVE